MPRDPSGPVGPGQSVCGPQPPSVPPGAPSSRGGSRRRGGWRSASALARSLPRSTAPRSTCGLLPPRPRSERKEGVWMRLWSLGCRVSRGGSRLLPLHCRRLARPILAARLHPEAGRVVGGPSPLRQLRTPGCRRYEQFYRNRLISVSKESSRRAISARSSYVVDRPPSVIRKYSRRMESSLV